jgi:hypothetical protein
MQLQPDDLRTLVVHWLKQKWCCCKGSTKKNECQFKSSMGFVVILPVKGSIRGNWLLMIITLLQMWWNNKGFTHTVAVRDNIECSSWYDELKAIRSRIESTMPPHHRVLLCISHHNQHDGEWQNIYCHQKKLEQDKSTIIRSIHHARSVGGMTRATIMKNYSCCCYTTDDQQQYVIPQLCFSEIPWIKAD